jgi:predicted ThiF/HesA family dinucleotide-utilizing enzyme
MSESEKQHQDKINEGTFLMVCSGETYFTETVKGEDLVHRIMAATSGENKLEWLDKDVEFWEEQIYEPDNLVR